MMAIGTTGNRQKSKGIYELGLEMTGNRLNLENKEERWDNNLRLFSSLVRWTTAPFKETGSNGREVIWVTEWWFHLGCGEFDRLEDI